MSDSDFSLKSVPGVQFYFFRGVLESEFLARSIWALELYPSIIWNVFKMQKMHAHNHTKKHSIFHSMWVTSRSKFSISTGRWELFIANGDQSLLNVLSGCVESLTTLQSHKIFLVLTVTPVRIQHVLSPAKFFNIGFCAHIQLTDFSKH